MKQFGLIGRHINYSYSKKLFDEIIDTSNYNYEIYNIEPDELNRDFLLKFDGLNVTIPYKQDVIQYLDEIENSTKEIGAVNCIKNENEKLIGYNTDIIGIDKTLKDHIRPNMNALVLGNGGVSKAILYYLKENSIIYKLIGRSGTYDISFNNLSSPDISKSDIIINATPVGTFPNINNKLDIDYTAINSNCIIFDVIYNPKETAFMKECKKYTSGPIINGSKMLEEQALASYNIWKIL